MLNYLKARWGETTSHAAIVGAVTSLGAYLDGKIDAHSLYMAGFAAVLAYVLPNKSTPVAVPAAPVS